jgi:hypothetical protein
VVGLCAVAVALMRGAVRVALGTALLVWLVTSAVATVEQTRATWLLVGTIALAGRLAATKAAQADMLVAEGLKQAGASA